MNQRHQGTLAVAQSARRVWNDLATRQPSTLILVAITCLFLLLMSGCIAPEDDGVETGSADASGWSSLVALEDGGVFHSRTEHFKRHDPNLDPEILANDPYAFPEKYVHEVWYRISPDGTIAEGISVVRDLSGVLLQISRDKNGELVVESPTFDTTETLSLPPEPREVGMRSLFERARPHYEGAVAAGSMSRLLQPGDAEAGLLRFEEQLTGPELVPSDASDVTGTSYPYIDDLAGAQFYREHVVTSEYLPVSTTTWAERADGSHVLIERTEWKVFEGLSADAWDSDEFLDQSSGNGHERFSPGKLPTSMEDS